MITETEFARRYTSTWRILTPMTEDFVRHVNGSWCIREFSPIRSALVRRDRHAVINEAAFRAFVLARRSAIVSSSDLLSTEIDEFLSDAITELLVDPQWTDKVYQFDEYERPQAIELCWRLNTFFTARDSGDLVLFPQFKGCGLLDRCAGDVLVGNTLYEVKAGGRFFRSIDLRQLLVYSMLSWQQGTYKIERLGMFNPRVGIYFEEELGEVCYEVSGKTAIELFADMSQIVAGSDFSR